MVWSRSLRTISPAFCRTSNESLGCSANLVDARRLCLDGFIYQRARAGALGMTSDGEHRFEIVSTRTDGMRLCRVVNIESENRFHTESFCKARGGEWR
jgi:hypothetical protein